MSGSDTELIISWSAGLLSFAAIGLLLYLAVGEVILGRKRAAYAAGADVSLVVNRIRAKSVEDGTSPDMDEIIDSVGIKLLGLIPEDGKTSEALNAGKLITDIKRSRSKKSYANIAARVDGEFTELYRFW